MDPFFEFVSSALGRTKITNVSAEQAFECSSISFHNSFAAILTRFLISTVTKRVESSKRLILLHTFVAAIDPKVLAAKFELFFYLIVSSETAEVVCFPSANLTLKSVTSLGFADSVGGFVQG